MDTPTQAPSVANAPTQGQTVSVGTGDSLGVRPRTRFGHPITLRNGEDSSLWSGDRVTVLRRSGRHALCAIDYGHPQHLKRIEAWLPKRRLRFASPNT